MIIADWVMELEQVVKRIGRSFRLRIVGVVGLGSIRALQMPKRDYLTLAKKRQPSSILKPSL